MTTRTEAKRALCLWLPSWPIQRLVAAQPELKRQQVILFRRDPRRGQLVSAVSPLASQHGARCRMPLSEAKSLLQRNANRNANRRDTPQPTTSHRPPVKLNILLHDPRKDRAGLENLADSLERFSPIVGVQQVDPPDCLLLDVTGLQHLFGGENQLARQVLQHCQVRGYVARIAIADTPGLAWGAARFLVRDPTGPLVIPVHDSHIMPGLPVQALRLSEPVTETLHQLGILNIEQLLQLPRRDLAARFGDEIHRRLDQMTGILEEPIVARRKPATFDAKQLLDFPTSDRETVETILQQLIGQLCHELSGRQQGALEWTVKMYCQNKRLPLQFRVRLFQPTSAVEQIMQLVQMQLQQAWQVRPTRKEENDLHSRHKKPRRRRQIVKLPDGQTMEINEVSVEVTSCVLLTHQQRQLFDERPRENRQELAQLINRLASRLGTEQVVYPTLRRQAQPEHAFRFQPLIHTGKRPRSTGKPGHLSHVMARPLQLYEPPIPLTPGLTATANRSNASDSLVSPPDRVQAGSAPGFGTPSIPGQQNDEATRPEPVPSSSHGEYQIVHSWGPERIETGWWRGRLARRDYWRVETSSHQQFWIYRDLNNGDWFLHGAF
ncbi:MAG: DNA polymerase Y family protein [Mariniblastus sp.]|nr:DNA polymerase Y family protein [Mariniblastus sp.]